jgi:hypothetical protein
MLPDLENPSPEDLDQIRRFLEEADRVDVVTDGVRALVEKHWPWLLPKLPPREEH